MEYSFRFFLLVFVVCFVNGSSTKIETFCVETPFKLSCPENTFIVLQPVTNVDSRCNTVKNINTCLENIRNILQTNCLGKNNCTLYPSMSGCERIPRYITTKYQCSWIFGTYELSTSICTNTLSNINCLKYDRKWWDYYTVEITEVSFVENLNTCSNCQTSTVQQLLEEFCDHEKYCKNPSDVESCLFQFNPAAITYSCEASTSLSYPVTTTKNDTSLTTKGIETEITLSSDEAPSTPTTDENHVYLKLDYEGRILLSGDMFGNYTVMLCGEGWDDQDAYVVCRHQENSTGQALVVEGVKGYKTLPIVIQCQGNETNPFACNYISMSECNVSTVAAVTCCKNSSGSRKGCQSAKVEKLSSTESANNIAIGLSLGLSVVIAVAVVVLLINLRRSNRCKREKNVSSIINKNDGDYVGNQGISLSYLEKKSKNLTETDSKYCNKRELKYDERRPVVTSNQGTVSLDLSPHLSGTISIKTAVEYDGYECAKGIDNESNNASETTYACSEDGVYDKLNKNRYEPNDCNVYNHSIDTVYDTSDQKSNKEPSADTYLHCIGLKSDDNYDLAIRK